MDTKAIIAIASVAAVIIGIDLAKGRMKGPVSGPPPSDSQRTWTSGRIAAGWVIMLTLTNALGLAAAVGSWWLAAREQSVLWLAAVFIGWLASLAYIARPIAFPRDYRAYWDKQDRPPPGTILLAPFVLFWMAAMVAVSFDFLNDLG